MLDEGLSYDTLILHSRKAYTVSNISRQTFPDDLKSWVRVKVKKHSEADVGDHAGRCSVFVIVTQVKVQFTKE